MHQIFLMLIIILI